MFRVDAEQLVRVGRQVDAVKDGRGARGGADVCVGGRPGSHLCSSWRGRLCRPLPVPPGHQQGARLLHRRGPPRRLAFHLRVSIFSRRPGRTSVILF